MTIAIGKDGFWASRQCPDASLREAADLFDKRGGKVLVEIGSGLHGSLAGNSMVHWLRTSASSIIAVDTKTKWLRTISGIDPRIRAVKDTAQNFSKTFAGSIDLLYLDFPVPDTPEDLQGTARSQIYLQVYQNIKDCLSSKAIILIDDTDHIHPWKDTQIVPQARNDGFKVEWVGRQTLLLR